jgi:hypothetical protein
VEEGTSTLTDLQTTTTTATGGVGHSAADDARTAGHDAVDAALGGARARAGDLVLVFPSVRYDLEALHAAAAERAAPAAVVGATTAGAFTSTASVAGGCVAAHLPGDGLTFGIANASWDRADPVGSALAVCARARDRAGEERPHSTLLLLADGIEGHGREFARGAYDVTSALVPLVGGAAADDLRGRTTWTFGDGAVRPDGIAAVWIDSDEPVGVGTGHGFHPVGQPHVVTRTQERHVAELDGRPALEIYLGELGGRLPSSTPMRGGHIPSHPLGAITVSGGHDLYPVGPAGTGLHARAAIEEGTLVQVMATDERSLAAGAREAAADAARQLRGPARLGLAFSSVDRVALLGGADTPQTAALGEGLGGAPVAGFHGYGQFGRRIGPGGFHMHSVTVLAIP